jgi:hypothetical protein
LILEKRKIGRKVGENWIRRNARIEFEKLWPYKVTVVERKKVFADMSFSNGWLAGFLRRKNLSLRQPTKKAQAIPQDYKEKIISWLQFNRRAMAKFNFELSEIANMDQTPISFEFLDNKTYDTKGVKTVFVKQTGSGWDRRQATLQIIVHADGIQRCKPLLVFHGKNLDYRQKPKSSNLKKEYKFYDPRVEVMFNPRLGLILILWWNGSSIFILLQPISLAFLEIQHSGLLDSFPSMYSQAKRPKKSLIVLKLLIVLHHSFLEALLALFKSAIHQSTSLLNHESKSWQINILMSMKLNG